MLICNNRKVGSGAARAHDFAPLRAKRAYLRRRFFLQGWQLSDEPLDELLESELEDEQLSLEELDEESEHESLDSDEGQLSE